MKAVPKAITITPGMCALVENLAPEILRDKWDLFVIEVFNKEASPIYDRAMATCAMVRLTRMNLALGRKMFKDQLTADQIAFQYEPVPDFILSYYWALSKLGSLWKPAIGMGNHAPFATALEIWQETRSEDIEFCRRSIQEWVQ
jgi:hypothetical protein